MSGSFVYRTQLQERSALRQAVDRRYRADEAACVAELLAELELSPDSQQRIDRQARRLVEAVRAERLGKGGLDAFLHEYGLSTQEGVLLMCIAEALLRVPDDETQERLIRDKISVADWDQHFGHSKSFFVNASTWALMLTGRVVRLHGHEGKSAGAAMRRLIARLGEPVVREATWQAMRIMGRQFVMGESIEGAIDRARETESRGYTYSYDMLGEAARTQADAQRYFDSYKHAIEAIGRATEGQGPKESAGISVKLSALHPRYEVAQEGRVMDELVPRLKALCLAAAEADIGLNIDAEEAARLDLSLDIFEEVSGDKDLSGWDGFGVVVQAYQKRGRAVIDWLADMAERHRRQLMLRLVKGAYWDTEIKLAQELGLDGYPVFTRKPNTDVSYLACARRMFEAHKHIYPQLATHNAHTIAAVMEFAGNAKDFEFQRLHGMGESLYEELIEQQDVGVGCRIYAPVGVQEDLLAYLVRRLLENGANSSFVNRLQDDQMPVDEIIADPIATVRGLKHVPHPRIPAPRDLYGPARKNSAGIDVTDKMRLATLSAEMGRSDEDRHTAAPIIAGSERHGDVREVVSPADNGRVIGRVTDATPADVDAALEVATKAARDWAATPVEQRAACLDRAAELMERDGPKLMALFSREAGKTIADGIGEYREAADFCRYYAMRAREEMDKPFTLRVPAATGATQARLEGGGVFACISPWNFPFAIFNGQITAALVAGNAVVAKPAEQTPLIAAAGVRLLHEAGIPPEVLGLLPGDGETVGARLVADPRVSGVCFTGSTEVAHLINRELAERDGGITPLIAETGGQNTMIVDSTALPEQVVEDAVASAFQSAGQRCSALRVMFVQEDVADKMLEMLAGAMEELRVGDPAFIDTDVGPVIDTDAQAILQKHVKRMLGEARLLKQVKPGPGTDRGTFVPPAAFEIESLRQLEREVFGPIMHIVRYRADRLPQVMDAINATGYGLTLGVHTRIDSTWRYIFERARVGNVYVNRNQIGAVVGVQPFGGQGLSGTGPKAGGPNYLRRFVAYRPADGAADAAPSAEAALDLAAVRLSRAGFERAIGELEVGEAAWARLDARARADALEEIADALEIMDEADAGLSGDGKAARLDDYLRFYATQARDAFAEPQALPGPTGERDDYALAPRGILACLGMQAEGGISDLGGAVAAALAAGNRVAVWHPEGERLAKLVALFHAHGVPQAALQALPAGDDADAEALLHDARLEGAVVAGPAAAAAAVNRVLAARDGAILPTIVHTPVPSRNTPLGQPAAGSPHYVASRFAHEKSLSIDTTASGGNASLFSLEDEGGAPG